MNSFIPETLREGAESRFRGEDEFKVWTLRGLAAFKNVEFKMNDVFR